MALTSESTQLSTSTLSLFTRTINFPMSSPPTIVCDFSDDELPSEDWPEMEFRSPEDKDQAWYGVEPWDMCDSLVVSFNGFTCAYDEVYSPEDFKNSDELKAFEERFRPTSVQMQDNQCPTVNDRGESTLPNEGSKTILDPPLVNEGTKVCATCPSVTGEVNFYDAIVVAVERSEHGWDEEGNEVCGCNFKLFWNQGPCANLVTSAKVGDICLKREDGRLHPKVVSFFKEATRQLHGGSSQGEETEWQKMLKRVNAAVQNYNINSSVPDNLG